MWRFCDKVLHWRWPHCECPHDCSISRRIDCHIPLRSPFLFGVKFNTIDSFKIHCLISRDKISFGRNSWIQTSCMETWRFFFNGIIGMIIEIDFKRISIFTFMIIILLYSNRNSKISNSQNDKHMPESWKMKSDDLWFSWLKRRILVFLSHASYQLNCFVSVKYGIFRVVIYRWVSTADALQNFRTR